MPTWYKRNAQAFREAITLAELDPFAILTLSAVLDFVGEAKSVASDMVVHGGMPVDATMLVHTTRLPLKAQRRAIKQLANKGFLVELGEGRLRVLPTLVDLLSNRPETEAEEEVSELRRERWRLRQKRYRAGKNPATEHDMPPATEHDMSRMSRVTERDMSRVTERDMSRVTERDMSEPFPRAHGDNLDFNSRDSGRDDSHDRGQKPSTTAVAARSKLLAAAHSVSDSASQTRTREPQQPKLVFPEEQAARETLAAIWRIVQPHVRGMTRTEWATRNKRYALDMARAGVALEAVVSAQKGASERLGNAVYSLKIVQDEIARGGAPLRSEPAPATVKNVRLM